MNIMVQIPALNEEPTITRVIQAVYQALAGLGRVQVLVIDDGSTDRTGTLAAAAGAAVIRHETRQGVGAAFRTGLCLALETGPDILVTLDGDGQFDPADIPRLMAPILKGEADFVTASRFLDPQLVPVMPGMRRWGNAFMAHWISSLTGQPFTDVSCGFRAYNPQAYLRLMLLGDFTYTHETFLNLAFEHVRIREMPIPVRGVRAHGQSRVAGSLMQYAWRAAAIILKTYRDYCPLRFCSWVAAGLLVLSLALLVFLFSVKFRTGMFTPHKWSGILAMALAGAALGVFLAGLVAQMLERLRVGQNEILYRLRRLEIEGRKAHGADVSV